MAVIHGTKPESISYLSIDKESELADYEMCKNWLWEEGNRCQMQSDYFT